MFLRGIALGLFLVCGSPVRALSGSDDALDAQLVDTLHHLGFTGTVGSQLESRLGRPVDPALADLGRLLLFDKIPSLHSDNACAGCHSPQNGFGDTQSIAIRIQNNNIAGSSRQGPRNQRRTPMLLNTVFFPKLMWNGRFASASGNPFDNSLGFVFPQPEGTTRFPPHDPVVLILAQAQAQMPPTEMTEVAGFTGTKGTIGRQFDQFDDGLGTPVPPPDASGYRNDPIRQAVLARLNASPEYRALFGRSFPSVAHGGPIDFTMFGLAIAEFEFTLVYADAPLDQFTRGNHQAMTAEEKRGALLFFGKAGCVQCHAVGGHSNEMFSDFQNHVAGIPQIAPFFGIGKGNVIFDGPNADEDFGMEQISGDPADRYKFRTAPLRNLALQPAYFHNGSFTRLDDAIRHHLDASYADLLYNAVKFGVAKDLTSRLGPSLPVLARIDPLLAGRVDLAEHEFQALVRFVEQGLRDPRAAPDLFCRLVPSKLPSGMTPIKFRGCPQGDP